MAYTGSPGWDAAIYAKAIHYLRHGVDPYSAGIAEQRAYLHLPVSSRGTHPPFAYVYSPLTIPFLRLLGFLPHRALLVFWIAVVAAGFLLQLWGGFQMATRDERRWLVVVLPVTAFFPALVLDDVILSGNVAFLLYGLVLASSVAGWQRGRWRWYYLSVLVASIVKAPMLTLLAFPVLAGKRQWLPAAGGAFAGLLLIVAQALFWPQMFRQYLLAVRMVFDVVHDFGYGPGGAIGRILWNWHKPYSAASTAAYLVSVVMLAVTLLCLARRVRQNDFLRSTWIPVSFLGTILFYPRLMKYDMASITVPMLLIVWRTLREVSRRSSSPRLHGATDSNAVCESTAAPSSTHPSARDRMGISIILIAAVCFLIPNVMTVCAPPWWPVELVVLLATFSMGVWLLLRGTQIHPEIRPITELPSAPSPI